jgi:flagella basal body P-ring formation protein FlgA
MSLALMLAAAVAANASFTDLDSLDRAIAGFTGAPIGQVGGAITPVDRRLRLQPCSLAPVLTWLSARRDAVMVQCPDAGSWRLSVPVQRSGGGMLEASAVSRGDAVTIQVEGEGFSVSRPGQVLEAGAVGAWVRVAPTVSGPAQAQPLRAQVVRPGLVRVPLE